VAVEINPICALQARTLWVIHETPPPSPAAVNAMIYMKILQSGQRNQQLAWEMWAKESCGQGNFSPAVTKTARHLAGTLHDFYNPLVEDRSAWLAHEHPIAKTAEERLLSEYVPIYQMPIELRQKKALERAEWIASHGSDHPIPDVFSH
jgi:hypothetical protein